MLTQDELKEPFAGTRIKLEDVHASMSLLNTGFLKVGQAVFDKSQEDRAPSNPITGMDDTNGYVPVQTGALKRSGSFASQLGFNAVVVMTIKYSVPYALRVEFGTDDPDNQVTADYSDEIDPNTYYTHSKARSGYYSQPGMKAVQGSDGQWYTKRWNDVRGFQGRAYYRRARLHIFNRAFKRRMGFQTYLADAT